jgi:hypothetical protein
MNGGEVSPSGAKDKPESVRMVNGSKPAQASDDPDPVVQEIPVFLAKELAKKLFLFQVSSFDVFFVASTKATLQM